MSRRSRFTPLFLLLGIFLTTSAITRTVLLVMALPDLGLGLSLLFRIYGEGLFFDTVTFSYMAIPFLLYTVLAPDWLFNSRLVRPFFYLVFFAAMYLFIFDGAAEYFFFDEFGTRFNFIAVDYLVYTTAVVRNIAESYNLPVVLGSALAVNVVFFIQAHRSLRKSFGSKSRLKDRLKIGAVLAAAPILAFVFVERSWTDVFPNNYAAELAGNGIYDLFAAYRDNELDYEKFYKTMDEKSMLAGLRGLLAGKDSRFLSDDPKDMAREVTNPGPEKRLNVIVVVEESLSAEFLGAFGNRKGLTPNLDALAGKSLLFTRLYACGTRTVRGLEAIDLSLPPLPGEAIIRRKDHAGLFSWGSIMKEKGYGNKFIYGGYGYFDNMNNFFGDNGFNIVDRVDFKRGEVTFSNAWGVCDGDLFRKVVSEAGKSYATGKPFFYMVMTTSNHRPYTYPGGEVDIPPHSGRDGAVEYADYAIGRLIDEAGKQPWSKDTVIVIVADHCAGSARKVALPVKDYEIPMFVYSPAHIRPGKVDTMMSQIDIAPTVMGLLGFSYRTKLFGHDVLRLDPKKDASGARAFISTYQKMGYLKGGKMVVLGPKKTVGCFSFKRADGTVKAVKPVPGLVDEMIEYTQGANYVYKRGLYRTGDAPPKP